MKVISTVRCSRVLSSDDKRRITMVVTVILISIVVVVVWVCCYCKSSSSSSSSSPILRERGRFPEATAAVVMVLSMDALQRRVRLVLVQVRSAVTVQETAATLFVVVRVPVLGPENVT